ncbi:3-demethylubiquinone-9 3-methyltransferase [Alkalibacterium subtropicum]|uniref:3-demethylubiquinone-9 3-methyltransferase n=1 Tax=Alkalibacterium subtropicum TaxID=753702 RepID=A0A1I1HHQ2_9LACT|nr:VOC family protein [Alkalibacterium subtropicum]SFC23102.1 3-demethylubiquinone-9 3-methyltransferase [Alkalibacterium subtropicum]
MKAIVRYLWFDTEAKIAAEFYVSLFDDSKITSSYILEDIPSSDSTAVNFELDGQPFAAISAGPYFTFNPSLSIMVHCTSEEVDELLRAAWMIF